MPPSTTANIQLYPGLDPGQATADRGLGEHTDSDICYNWVRDWHKIHLSRNASDHNICAFSTEVAFFVLLTFPCTQNVCHRHLPLPSQLLLCRQKH